MHTSYVLKIIYILGLVLKPVCYPVVIDGLFADLKIIQLPDTKHK